MSIQRLLISLSALASVLLALALIGVIGLLDAYDKLDQQRRGYQQTHALMHQLEESSDDLTRYARTAVTTLKPVYHRLFNDLLALRSGVTPSLNWQQDLQQDWLSATHWDGPHSSIADFEQQLHDLPFTEQERTLLALAERRSIALTEREQLAIHAAHGRFLDSYGKFTREGPAEPHMATKLLYDKTYLDAKRGIMQPIEQAFALLEARQEKALRQAEQQRLVFSVWLIVVLLAGIATAVAFHQLISRRIVRPLLGMVARTEQFTLGQGNNRLMVRYDDEFGALAKAFNTLMQRVENNLSLLEVSANTDPLTGLDNRRQFEHDLLSECLRMQRSQQPISLIMVDVDNFKAYNDRYGHPAGDVCLQKLAQALKQGLQRPGDRLARYGGEEFVCLLPETDSEQALHVAHNLLQSVRDLALPHRDNVVPIVTISLGVCSLSTWQVDMPHVLLQRADELLYQAKHAGRNQICTSDQCHPANMTLMPKAPN